MQYYNVCVFFIALPEYENTKNVGLYNVHGQLILRKISKTGATRCQMSNVRLKCSNFDFGRGSDPLGELTSLPHDPLAVFKGPLLRGGGEGRDEPVKSVKPRTRDSAR